MPDLTDDMLKKMQQDSKRRHGYSEARIVWEEIKPPVIKRVRQKRVKKVKPENNIDWDKVRQFAGTG